MKRISQKPSTNEPYRPHFSTVRQSFVSKYGMKGTKMLEGLKMEHEKELERMSLQKYDLFIGEYELLSVLHKGNYGKVLLVKNQSSKALFAMKLTNVEKTDFSQIMNEKMIMERISNGECSFLISAVDYILANGHVGFVMEYIPSISLSTQVSLARKLSEEKVVFYAACILCAIEYLHSQYIYHRDITLRNILIDKTGYIKLVDFGVSQFRPPDKLTIGRRSTLRMDQLIDFEDLGRCTWELLTAESVMTIPDYQKTNLKMSSNCLKFFELLFPRNKVSILTTSDKMISLLLDHPFFRSIKWDDLKARKTRPPFMLKIQPEIENPTSAWHEINHFFNQPYTNLAEEFRPVSTWRVEKRKPNRTSF